MASATVYATPAEVEAGLQQAQAAMKKARQALRLARGDSQSAPHALTVGWESLAQAHRLMESGEAGGKIVVRV